MGLLFLLEEKVIEQHRIDKNAGHLIFIYGKTRVIQF